MELLLNLIWVALVAASAVRFAVWSRGASPRRRFAVGVAAVCILALLFPIISITDDLHLKKAIVEEARTTALMPVAIVVVFAPALVGTVHIALAAIPAAPSHAAVVERGPPV